MNDELREYSTIEELNADKDYQKLKSDLKIAEGLKDVIKPDEFGDRYIQARFDECPEWYWTLDLKCDIIERIEDAILDFEFSLPLEELYHLHPITEEGDWKEYWEVEFYRDEVLSKMSTEEAVACLENKYKEKRGIK